MKKSFAILAAGLFSLSALAQTYPSPTFNSLTLQNPLAVSGGGTGATTSTGSGAAVLATSPAIASPAITGGTINGASVGATTPSTGAFTTLNASGATTQPSTGQFYANFGANVNRVNDRLFIGPATANLGTNVATQPDWLTTYQIAKGRTYGYVQTSEASILNNNGAQDDLTTLVVGAQNVGRPGGQVIAVTGMGVNNATSGGSSNQAWGGYYEAFRDTGTAGNGGAYGNEIDTMNFVGGTEPVTDPYSQSNDQIVGLQMASGGGFPGTLYPTTVGINFQNNNTTYDKGIVFGSNSITGDNGTSGSGVAIAFGRGHMLQWYGAAATVTSSILSNGTTTAGAIQQLMSDNQVSWLNASSNTVLAAVGASSGVNGVQVTGAATTASPQIAAVGTDTNVALTLSGKGTGGVAVQGTTNGSNAASGYDGEIQISDVTTPGTSLSSGAALNVTSKSIPAGAWACYGNIQALPAGTTALTQFAGWIGTTSITIPTNLEQAGYFKSLTIANNAGSPLGQNIGPVFFNFTTATTVYLETIVNFTTSTATAYGMLNCLRVH